MTTLKRFTIRLSPEKFQALKEFALSQNRSVNSVCVEMLEAEMQHQNISPKAQSIASNNRQKQLSIYDVLA